MKKPPETPHSGLLRPYDGNRHRAELFPEIPIPLPAPWLKLDFSFVPLDAAGLT